MSHFEQLPRAEIPRSTFDRSHGHKTTFDSGYLIPLLVDEVLPGDTYNVKANIFARLSTPIVPLMDNLYMDFFAFFVPNRLLWANWAKFMGEENNPGDNSTDYVVPVLDTAGMNLTLGSIYDYMGLPVPNANVVQGVCSLPFRAYNLIWNEWFRDENLQQRVSFTTGDGPDQTSWFALRRRGKRHDYFTSCLPWPQKGPGAEVPITGAVSGNPPTFQGANEIPTTLWSNPTGTPAGVVRAYAPPAADGALGWADPQLAANINSLRQAFQIQKLLERDARGGTRYIELLKAHFGVTNPDFRLQRPEFLGGGELNININPVAQTSGTPPDLATGYSITPQANLSAYGTAGGSPLSFTKSFTEHGYILVLGAVRADLSYQDGLHRMWTRKTRFDYYWPAFAHLGEQAVLNKEIFYSDAVDSAVVNEEVWGYQERWAEYRFGLSKVTGLFRSQAGNLDIWHLAQDFGVSSGPTPVLTGTFIEDNPPVDRIIAVPSEPQFLFDSWWTVKCTRPMPTFSVPGLVDHF